MITKMHVKKGDKVRVIAGKDKGKEGVVIRAFPKLSKVAVEGIALQKRMSKKQGKQSGHIVERPAPIAVSNVKKI